MEIKKIEGLVWARNPARMDVIKHAIIHHAAGNGTPLAIHKYHVGLGWCGIAYHYYITKSGDVYQGREETMQGGHTVGHNHDSIGICFEGDFTKEFMPVAQYKAGVDLIRKIHKDHPSIDFKPHSYYQATACPGFNMKWEEMVEAALKEKAPEPIVDAEYKSRAEPSEWAKEAVAWARGTNLYRGDGLKTVDFSQSFDKEEVLVLLYRLYGLLTEGE